MLAEVSSWCLDTVPVNIQSGRIPDRLKDGVREEVLKLVDLGIVVPSQSPWASPVVPVPKPDGFVRVCIDYRRLNSVTVGDPYYMCTLDEILERVGNSRAISKLDLAKGFYQIEVDSESVDKTAFIMPFGKYAFRRMPFGLKNAPAIFERCMEVVLGSCYTFAAPYIDDIIVFFGGWGVACSTLKVCVSGFTEARPHSEGVEVRVWEMPSRASHR